ncbi:hypothetical protein E1A91_D13G028800v1, partial [Gossypium mustelinum]
CLCWLVVIRNKFSPLFEIGLKIVAQAMPVCCMGVFLLPLSLCDALQKKKTMNACFLKIWASESADITLGILKQTLCIKKLRRYGLSGSPMFKSCYV